MSLHPHPELTDLADDLDDESGHDDPPRVLPHVPPQPVGSSTRHYPGEFLG